MNLSVVVVDDHPLVLSGIVATLAACPDLTVAGGYRSFDELEAAGGLGSARLLVSDIRIDGRQCLPLIRQLRAANPELKVVGITGIDDSTMLQQVMKAGLNGLVFKTDPVRELVEAVLHAGAGGQYFTEGVRKLLEDATTGASAGEAEALARLTPRERQILKLVCSGLSARLIAEELKISVWTVTNHKSNIMDKLGIRNQVGLTRFAIDAGLVEHGVGHGKVSRGKVSHGKVSHGKVSRGKVSRGKVSRGTDAMRPVPVQPD